MLNISHCQLRKYAYIVQAQINVKKHIKFHKKSKVCGSIGPQIVTTDKYWVFRSNKQII